MPLQAFDCTFQTLYEGDTVELEINWTVVTATVCEIIAYNHIKVELANGQVIEIDPWQTLKVLKEAS